MASKTGIYDQIETFSLNQAKRFIGEKLDAAEPTDEDLLTFVADGGLQPSIRVFDRFTTHYKPISPQTQGSFDTFNIQQFKAELDASDDNGHDHDHRRKLIDQFDNQLRLNPPVRPAPSILHLHIPPRILYQHTEIIHTSLKQVIFSCSEPDKKNSEVLYLLWLYPGNVLGDYFEYVFEIPPLTQWVFLRTDLDAFLDTLPRKRRSVLESKSFNGNTKRSYLKLVDLLMRECGIESSNLVKNGNGTYKIHRLMEENGMQNIPNPKTIRDILDEVFELRDEDELE